MTTGEKRLKGILEKIKTSGKLNFEDLKDLTADEKDLVQTLFKEGSIDEALIFLIDLNTDKDLQTVKRKLIDSKKRNVVFWKPALKYAAIFVGLFASVYYFQIKGVPETKPLLANEYIKLKMENDKILLVDQTSSQKIFSSSGKVIGKQEGINICYMADSKINELKFNELQIPNGKVFNLELSDGTIVNLNSGSKIRYPIRFLKGKKREVFIEGEAYFNVAKDINHPFIVNADDVAITVLGTKFNVSSYKEDSEITAVLIEGSVNIANTTIPDYSLVLEPGMMGSWHKSIHSLNADKVNTDLYVSWINGELIFRDSTFNAIVETLERKYNVTIENKNEALAKTVLTATFNINIESIRDVLNAINKIQPLNFTINDKHITILP